MPGPPVVDRKKSNTLTVVESLSPVDPAHLAWMTPPQAPVVAEQRRFVGRAEVAWRSGPPDGRDARRPGPPTDPFPARQIVRRIRQSQDEGMSDDVVCAHVVRRLDERSFERHDAGDEEDWSRAARRDGGSCASRATGRGRRRRARSVVARSKIADQRRPDSQDRGGDRRPPRRFEEQAGDRDAGEHGRQHERILGSRAPTRRAAWSIHSPPDYPSAHQHGIAAAHQVPAEQPDEDQTRHGEDGGKRPQASSAVPRGTQARR